MKTLIIKYLNDTLTEAEEILLNRWLQESENRKTFEEMVKIQYHLDYMNSDINTSKAYNSVLTNIQINRRNKRRIIKKIGYCLSAALLIGVFVGNFIINKELASEVELNEVSEITLVLEDGSVQTLFEHEQKEVKRNDGSYVTTQTKGQLFYGNVDKLNKGELAFNTLMVPNGKTFKLQLSDGSKVVLNSGTKLKYPIAFNSPNERRVYLEGEAYFEVVTNPEVPFIVETKDISVKALGTGFNVTSYLADKKTYAVLVHGKVEVNSLTNLAEKVVLKPNQKVDFSNQKLTVENVYTDKYSAWINGDLVFIGEPMQDVFNRLERKFDITIVNNSDRFDDIVLTARFSNESIEEIFETLNEYTNFNYKQNNKTIYITNLKL